MSKDVVVMHLLYRLRQNICHIITYIVLPCVLHMPCFVYFIISTKTGFSGRHHPGKVCTSMAARTSVRVSVCVCVRVCMHAFLNMWPNRLDFPAQDNKFVINENTGSIKTFGFFDYETKDKYRLTVKATVCEDKFTLVLCCKVRSRFS